MPVMATKPHVPARKGTWTLPTRKATLPPLQESHAEEEDYPSFDMMPGGTVKRSLFAKIFSIKPLTRVIQTTLPEDRLHTELLELLRRWEGMGIGIAEVTEEQRTNSIRAKLQSHNTVGLKAMRFRIQIISIGTASSNAVFIQDKGTERPEASFFLFVDEWLTKLIRGGEFFHEGCTTS
jgi:Fungal kinase associated-1 domain